MTNLKRYDTCGNELVECVAGEWIRFADAVNEIYRLRGEIERLRNLLGQASATMRVMARDIRDTARANQVNLTGLDLCDPHDPPIPSRIGNCQVHQPGINQSLRVAMEGELVAQEAAEAAKGASDE